MITLKKKEYKIKEIVTIDKDGGETFQENGIPAIIEVNGIITPNVYIDDYKIAFVVDESLTEGTYSSTITLESNTILEFDLVVYEYEKERPITKPKQTLDKSPKYLQTTKLYTQALTHVFDDLYLRYRNKDNEEFEIDVPVLMAHASKSWKTRKAINDELRKNKRFATLINYKTPCITVAYISKDRDQLRDVINKHNYNTFRSSDGTPLFDNRIPRPFNYKFRVEIWCYSQNHLEYIHEQLLPYIDEGFSITMNEFYGNQQYNRQVNVMLDSLTDWEYVETYGEDDNKEKHLVSRLDFTFEGYQYFPIPEELSDDIIGDIKFRIDTGFLLRTFNNSLFVPEYELVCSGDSDELDIQLRQDLAEDETAQNELIYENGACIYTYSGGYDDFKNVVVSDINAVSSDCCGLVGTKYVDESNIGDGKIITYDEGQDSMVYIDNQGDVKEYQTLIDDINIHSSYIGNAEQGVEPTDGTWRIIKSVEEDGEIVYYYPNGDSGFKFVWEQRENYSYSLLS